MKKQNNHLARAVIERLAQLAGRRSALDRAAFSTALALAGLSESEFRTRAQELNIVRVPAAAGRPGVVPSPARGPVRGVPTAGPSPNPAPKRPARKAPMFKGIGGGGACGIRAESFADRVRGAVEAAFK